MFIELHMIQNFSPSNLNRDDTNSPKDCEFGGHRRARISSQSLKRAIRREPVFENTTKALLGERSKWLTRPIITSLTDAGKPNEESQNVAIAFVDKYTGNMDKKQPNKTSTLLYFSAEECQLITTAILENWDAVLEEAGGSKGKTISGLATKIVKETKERTSAPDIALFGRMLADKPEMSIDAACQVSHAISTHRVAMEMDYYTAVDELLKEEEAGAGMVGFTSFNSACFYRYGRIDWKQLAQNLGRDNGLAKRTVEGFLRAAIQAIPTGKQNSFAAQNPTDFAMAIIRDDNKSWNLANAFEQPVRVGRESGLIEPSIAALDDYWNLLTSFYDDANMIAVSAHSLKYQDALNHLKPHCHTSLSSWLKPILSALPEV